MNFSRNRVFILAGIILLFSASSPYLFQKKFTTESLSGLNCDKKNEIALNSLNYYSQGSNNLDINAIYVLFHGDPNKELSEDSKLRSLAALELLKNSKNDSVIYFVGGKTKMGKISGSEKMKTYLSEKCPHISDRLHTLKNSNNTNDNIEEIAKFSQAKKTGHAVLISSSYHTQRINTFLKKFNLLLPAISAEEIIQLKGENNKEQIKKYESSFDYLMKKLEEKIGIDYQKFDPNQNIIRSLRNIERSF